MPRQITPTSFKGLKIWLSTLKNLYLLSRERWKFDARWERISNFKRWKGWKTAGIKYLYVFINITGSWPYQVSSWSDSRPICIDKISTKFCCALIICKAFLRIILRILGGELYIGNKMRKMMKFWLGILINRRKRNIEGFCKTLLKSFLLKF